MASGRKSVSWEKAIDEAFKALKPQLDFLREHDLKAKASRRPPSA